MASSKKAEPSETKSAGSENLQYAGDTASLVNEKNKSGMSSLMIAAKNGHTKLVKDLLIEGADVLATDDNQLTALHYAAQQGHLPVVTILLDSGSNIEGKTAHGDTPLIVAAMNGQTEIVKFLLQSGAEVSATGEHHNTALHWAAQEGHISMAKILLDYRSNIEVPSVGGDTPLTVAVKHRHEEIVSMLLKYAKDKNHLPVTTMQKKLQVMSTAEQSEGAYGSSVVTVENLKVGKVNLTDQCYLAAADETLEDQNVLNTIHMIDRGICFKLPNEIISKDACQYIRKATTDTEALGLLKEALKKSLVPRKMSTFIEILKESHKIHAEKIETHYKSYLKYHSCPLCHGVSDDKSSVRVAHFTDGGTGHSKDNSEGKSTQEMAWQEVNITESDHYSPQERVSYQALEKQSTLPVKLPLSVQPVDIKELHFDRNNRLGRGRYGIVYQGTFRNTSVAVKDIQITKQKNTNMTQILNEINISDVVYHPNIIHSLGYAVEEEDSSYNLLLLLELVDGKNLYNLLIDSKFKEEFEITDNSKYDILCDVAKAIAHLHSYDPPIIHGDIKPGNIMITRRKEVKLCDLGSSKIKYDSSMATTTVKGTPVYLAPEQLISSTTSSTKTDVYSFGVTIYEVIYEEHIMDVHDQENLIQCIKDGKVLEVLHSKQNDPCYIIISTCLKREPSERPKAEDILDKLEKLCEDMKK